MELTRLAHPVLFWVNVVMVVYTLYGYVFPRSLDFFWHPGTTFYRVVTSSTVEFSTGIYGIYGQLALTLIAAFLLLAGVANGFNAQHAMINVVRLFCRSRRLMPQTAVVGSSAIGLISGSGSANAAVVGTITIPLMVRYGAPPTFAAAVETSASIGGLIDPPMMGAAAFLMAEFLGVPYWDVVLRGFGFSFIYYISIGVAIYLLSVRLLSPGKIDKPQVPLYEKVTTGIFSLQCSISFICWELSAGASCARRSVPRAGCLRCWSWSFSTSSTCARILSSRGRRCSPASGAGSKRMPRWRPT